MNSYLIGLLSWLASGLASCGLVLIGVHHLLLSEVLCPGCAVVRLGLTGLGLSNSSCGSRERERERESKKEKKSGLPPSGFLGIQLSFASRWHEFVISDAMYN